MASEVNSAQRERWKLFQALQQTCHAISGFSGFSACSRVSRMLGCTFGCTSTINKDASRDHWRQVAARSSQAWAACCGAAWRNCAS
jgi:hypothetical protein